MNPYRTAFAALLGRRPARTRGTITTPGLTAPVTVRRDRWGVPHVDASCDADAWFGLGFCLGQDRSFQLETLLRAVRGTMSELVGPDGLALDRFSRRVGFRRAAERQMPVIDEDVRAMMAAYADGVNAGFGRGRRRRAHEFTLLRARPSAWSAVDVLGGFVLLGNAMGSPWAAELARLRIAVADGPDAVAALEPRYPPEQPLSVPPGAPAGEAIDRLAAELEAFRELSPSGAGSNNWALAGERTASGRPLLANDTHLPTALPSPWYLAHVRTPDWEVAGAAFVGGPVFGAGHNGFCAWGSTLGYTDNADLFLEEVGPDGRSVRAGDDFVACPARVETIEVRDHPPVLEQVLETPRGPIVSPASEEDRYAVALRAVWLEPRRVRGLLAMPKVRSVEDFRGALAVWPAPSLNVVYADSGGTVAWQLAGAVPRRDGGGAFPGPGWEPDAARRDGDVPFEEMPFAVDPPCGFVASANAKPVADEEGPYLGAEWADGYRMARVVEVLSARADWTPDRAAALQLDEESLPWRDLRPVVLAVEPADGDARLGLDLLREWDGRVAADSPAASVFELLVENMIDRLIVAKAPRSARWARGAGVEPLRLYGEVVIRRMSHLVRLLSDQPDGWLDRPWAEEIADALGEAVRRLRRLHGADPSGWAWGRIRRLTMRHPLSARRPLGHVFDIGPLTCGGDANTPAQATVDPWDPLGNPLFVATMRMCVEIGDWERARFSICGGQSGNPVSSHYEDQIPVWASGDGLPIAWSEAAVADATVATLRVAPE